MTEASTPARTWLDPESGVRYREYADGSGGSLVAVTLPPERPAARGVAAPDTPRADRRSTAALLRLVVS
jgi:hypothetical protein